MSNARHDLRPSEAATMRMNAANEPIFPMEVLHSIIGGSSAIDLPRLYLADEEDAARFLGAYGFDLGDPQDREAVSDLRHAAWALVEEELLTAALRPPRQVREMADVAALLVQASRPPEDEVQRWCCAILRVMHVLAHVRSPFEDRHGEAIRAQILRRFAEHIRRDDDGLKLGSEGAGIPLIPYFFRASWMSSPPQIWRRRRNPGTGGGRRAWRRGCRSRSRPRWH